MATNTTPKLSGKDREEYKLYLTLENTIKNLESSLRNIDDGRLDYSTRVIKYHPRIPAGPGEVPVHLVHVSNYLLFYSNNYPIGNTDLTERGVYAVAGTSRGVIGLVYIPGEWRTDSKKDKNREWNVQGYLYPSFKEQGIIRVFSEPIELEYIMEAEYIREAANGNANICFAREIEAIREALGADRLRYEQKRLEFFIQLDLHTARNNRWSK